MYIKQVSSFITALLITCGLYAQPGVIETRLCFADTTSTPFTGEWQYLSTDIFLFNGQQFSKVINDLYVNPEKKGKKRGLANEDLEYLYITAQLVNVKYFGDNDVVYPLYNFQINKDKDNKYKTYVNDNIESIRIIDNLPLHSAANNIDAKIDVKAITSSDKDNILGFFGKQLQNLAQLTRPTGAVLSLIGEMGNYIESNARKKEYKFSSTIRLFEQKNFDTRLHSLRVYVIVTPNTPNIRLNSSSIRNYLDTVRYNSLTRDVLKRMLAYQAYPLLVVANYKSQYKMEGISGDEINFSNIDRRKVNIENNYRDKMISQDTYNQEKNFTNFLTLFANFKSQLELYTLNARTGNVDAATTALGTVVQSYIILLQEYDVTNYKYRTNSTFNSAFKSEYASTVDFASFYLENDHSLRGAKLMSNTLININKKGMPEKLDQKETAIRSLRFIDNLSPDFKAKTKEGQNINTLISQLENSTFTQYFAADISRLNASVASSDKNEALQQLSLKMGATPCKICRDRAKDAINSYYDRLEVSLKVDALNKYQQMLMKVEPHILALSEKSKLLERNFATQFPDNSSMEAETYQRRVNEIVREVKNVENIVRTSSSDKSSTILISMGEKIKQGIENIETNFTFIEQNKASLLSDPNNVSIEKIDQ